MSASARCIAPWLPRAHAHTLPERAQTTCQRVLTVGSGDRGGILEALQRCINLEHVSDVLCALDFTLIP